MHEQLLPVHKAIPIGIVVSWVGLTLIPLPVAIRVLLSIRQQVSVGVLNEGVRSQVLLEAIGEAVTIRVQRVVLRHGRIRAIDQYLLAVHRPAPVAVLDGWIGAMDSHLAVVDQTIIVGIRLCRVRTEPDLLSVCKVIAVSIDAHGITAELTFTLIVEPIQVVVLCEDPRRDDHQEYEQDLKGSRPKHCVPVSAFIGSPDDRGAGSLAAACLCECPERGVAR